MKTLRLLIFACILAAYQSLHAQSTLAPGDIMFVGYQTNAPDSYAFVVLRELAPGTKIRFTDKAIIGTTPITLCSNENEMEWTSPSTPTPVGTVVTVEDAAPNASVNIGTASGTLSGLAAAGDQILAFQPIGNNDFNFIAAISSFSYAATCLGSAAECGGANNNNTCLPPSLANTQFAVGFSSLEPNRFYNGPTTFQNIADLRNSVSNAANWVNQNKTNWPANWSFNISTSIGEKLNAKPFHIFPNPNNGNFKIEINPAYTRTSVKISNIIGATVKTIAHAEGVHQVEIQEPGIYFVQVLSQGKALHTEKIIVR